MSFPEVPNGEWDVYISYTTSVSLHVTEDGLLYTFTNTIHGGPTKDPKLIFRAARELVANLPKLRADLRAKERDADALSQALGVPVKAR